MCVTGLVTVPTATTWSVFGKIVILGLIQFGGLGIMACMIMIFLVLRRKISLQSRKLIQDTYNLPMLKGSVGIVRRLLIGTAVVEIAGAICYSFWFVPHYGLWRGIGYSIFPVSYTHLPPRFPATLGVPLVNKKYYFISLPRSA